MAEKNNKEKVKNLQDEKSSLIKKIAASKKQIPADQATASAYGSQTNPEAKERKKQFAAKKNAEIQSIKLNTDRMKEIDSEISQLEKSDIEAESRLGENKLENKLENKFNIMAKLTKKEILNMVESYEPARMTKRELVESITNRILTEGIDDELRRKIESGEHDYSKYLDPETVKRMSREAINDVKANLESRGVELTDDVKENLDKAQALMSTGLFGALNKERRHKKQLEELAVKLVQEEWNIPEGTINFKVEITGHPQLGGRLIDKSRLKMKKGESNKRPPEGRDQEQLDKKITKRRFQNSIIQGSARKAQNLFHMASDELDRIAPGLKDDYSKVMAANDYTYWAVDKDTLEHESVHGLHAGQFRLDMSTTPPTIHAEGMTFSFLLHELGKAVPELIALWAREKDDQTREFVEDQTDNLEMEPDDIRLGVKIWEKILEVMDVDAIPYKAQVLQKIFMIGSDDDNEDEFNNLIRGLMNNSRQAIETIKDIVYETIRENNEDEVEQAMKQFRDDEPQGGTETPEGPEGPDEEDDLLKKLLAKKDDEDGGDPETWSLRELENARDEALDQGIKTGDYSMVAYYQTLIDKKGGR